MSSNASRILQSTQCTVCTKTFLTKKSLVGHMRKVHGGMSSKRADDEPRNRQSFPDLICGAHSVAANITADAVSTSTGATTNHPCKLCTKSFTTERGMKIHTTKVHGRHSIDSCDDEGHKSSVDGNTTCASNSTKMSVGDILASTEVQATTRRSKRLAVRRETADMNVIPESSTDSQDPAAKRRCTHYSSRLTNIEKDKVCSQQPNRSAPTFQPPASFRRQPPARSTTMEKVAESQGGVLKGECCVENCHGDVELACTRCSGFLCYEHKETDKDCASLHPHHGHFATSVRRKSQTRSSPTAAPVQRAAPSVSRGDINQSARRSLHLRSANQTVPQHDVSSDPNRNYTSQFRQSGQSHATPDQTASTPEDVSAHERYNRLEFYKAELDKDLKHLKRQFPQPKRTGDSDPRLQTLTGYHDKLLKFATDLVTLRISPEVTEVVADTSLIADEKRAISCPPSHLERITAITCDAKRLEVPRSWSWAANDDSQQGRYNRARLEYWQTNQLITKVLICAKCQSTAILIGHETSSVLCHDCMKLLKTSKKSQKAELDSWAKVRPASARYPTRVDEGHDDEDLEEMTDGERACVSLCHPVVTVKRSSFSCLKLRQENISLLQNPDSTWAKILPRTDLKARFMVLERNVKNATKRYIKVRVDVVRHWLDRMFATHPGFLARMADGRLLLSQKALAELAAGEGAEMAEVDESFEESDSLKDHTARQVEQIDAASNRDSQATDLSEHHTFSYETFSGLYMKKKEVLKIRDEGKIQFVEDPGDRKLAYNVSATDAFPYHYLNGESSPLDFDHHLAARMLKKQTLFPLVKADGKLVWPYASDHIHMVHQFAALQEKKVHDTVGFYLSQYPEKAHLPIRTVLDAFREGADDHGIVDSHLPGLTQIMTQVQNSRERWFAERLDIEAISQTTGDPNLFITLNCEPRAWPDCRRLIWQLEHLTKDGVSCEFDPDWFEKNTEAFTVLMNKYAVFLSIFLQRKVETFLEAFLVDICGVPKMEETKDSSATSTGQTLHADNGWYWARVEFTETRGVQHWHILVRLAHVLETSVLGRLIHNGRVVRDEIKRANIKEDKLEQAFELVYIGQLAQQYSILLADSISSTSFFDQHVDAYDESKLIDLEKLRDEYVSQYAQPDERVTRIFHPIMRRFDDTGTDGTPLCDENRLVEIAKIASVCQIHQCLPNSCGGNETTGAGCRFDFPKKKMKQTTAAIFQVNESQMEARLLLRRTHDRVNNLNQLIAYYWRANHDVQVLIDAGHTKRYVTKYCAKSSKHSEIMKGILEHLGERPVEDLPNNLRHALISILVASCSQRSFVSMQEVAYQVMELPLVIRSFPKVIVASCYERASLVQSRQDPSVLVYNDRTPYSAYCERCDKTTVMKNLTSSDMESMCLRDFVETVNTTWIKDPSDAPTTELRDKGKHRLRSCIEGSGHWVLSKRKKRAHVRFSTILYTPLAADYEPVEAETTTEQTTFMELSTEKRRQLARSHYELVVYVPWIRSPNESFLNEDTRNRLIIADPEYWGHRYSLMRLEEYFRLYKQRWDNGQVANPETDPLWHRDLQTSHTMYLVHSHNVDIALDRRVNDGRFNAQFEPADELAGSEIDIRPALFEEADDYDFPSPLSFLPPDKFAEMLTQQPMKLGDISVAYPMQSSWQKIQKLVTTCKDKRFMAKPPAPPVPFEQLSDVQKYAVELAVGGKQQVIYVTGPAGTGKSLIALHVALRMAGRVQCAASTGKSASIYNGPTVHGMFGFSFDDYSKSFAPVNSDSPKVVEMRQFYSNTELFIIDEFNNLSASTVGHLDEFMRACFNPRKTTVRGDLPPFGNRRLLLLGDNFQLPPISGPGVDDATVTSTSGKFYATKLAKLAHQGQIIYRQHIRPHCIMLQRSQRQSGLLAEISNALRMGVHTPELLERLCCMRRRYPDALADYGIHYSNEACFLHNSYDLWQQCKQNSTLDENGNSIPQRAFVCRASYYETADNQLIVDCLSSLPSPSYNYAQNLLVLTEGCEVRLIFNMNVAAGLVNGSIGNVVKVVYDDADKLYLLQGRHPSPYVVIVNFPTFRGFVDENNQTIFPFVRHQHWVPIYRQKFHISYKDLPALVRKKQTLGECYRLQFGLDLAARMTAHRSQGATLRNKLVSVDLELSNPSTKISNESTALLYVAMTRPTELRYLLMSPIYPTVWQQLGRDETSKRRREVAEELKQHARNFASECGKLELIDNELAWTPDYSGNDNEWKEIQTAALPSTRTTGPEEPLTEDAFDIGYLGQQFKFVLTPVKSERHVGIDQGEHHFAISVVDKSIGELPILMAAEVYDLHLPTPFSSSDVVISLQQYTDLFSWMQLDPSMPPPSVVDRVVVHVEQMSIHNKNAKQFGVQLAQMLQNRSTEPESCVVKLSSSNLHRPQGPTFRIGSMIIEHLNLKPVSYNTSASGSNPAARKRGTDSHSEVGSTDYLHRKKMSADVFRYTIEADDAQLSDMGLHVDNNLQQLWRQRFETEIHGHALKLDDVGDALLHALNDILCGSSNYKQQLPPKSSLHSNRTVAVSVFPDKVYWCSVLCTWNCFVIENIGWYDLTLKSNNMLYASKHTVRYIARSLSTDLKVALTDMTGGNIYSPVEHIKVVVKQQTAFMKIGLNRKQAGTLTNSTVAAMKKVCNRVMTANSNLTVRTDKSTGSTYMRTSRDTGLKYQVVRSGGKHTNAVLGCVSYFTHQMKSFSESRRLTLNEGEKWYFFNSLVENAKSGQKDIEMIRLSDCCSDRLSSFSDDDVYKQTRLTRNIADVILIALNKNLQLVKAVAANFRDIRSKPHLP